MRCASVRLAASTEAIVGGAQIDCGGAASSVCSSIRRHPPSRLAIASRSASAADAVAGGQLLEVGRAQVDRAGVAVGGHLVVLEHAEGVVVDEQRDEVQAVLLSGGKLMAAHQEAAVAGQDNDRRIRVGSNGAESGGQTGAEGAAHRVGVAAGAPSVQVEHAPV